MNFILPSITINIERWKWNKKYRVFVSNRGRVKNIDGEILKPKTTHTGYLAVKVKAKKAIFIHRLVMETWRPIPNPEEMTVDHLDHNKRNNDIRNLEWVTEKENHKRAINDQLVEKEVMLIRAEELKQRKKYYYIDCDSGIRFNTLNNYVDYLYKTDKNISKNEQLTPAACATRIKNKLAKHGGITRCYGHIIAMVAVLKD